MGIAAVTEIAEGEMVEQRSLVIQRVHLRREAKKPGALLQVHKRVVRLRVARYAREAPAEFNRLLDVVISLVNAFLFFVVLLLRGRPGHSSEERRASQQ